MTENNRMNLQSGSSAAQIGKQVQYLNGYNPKAYTGDPFKLL